MFKDINTEGLEQEEDRLGGYQLLESGLYDGVIKLAYVTSSQSSQAQCVTTVIDYDGHEMTERVWVTNRNNEPSYEKNGKKFMLPGFEMINSLCLMATGLPLADQDIEEKTINLWDSESRSEKPTNVPVITSLLTKKVSAGIIKQIVNKQTKNEASGKWEDTNDTREENVTDKYFHFDTKRTTAEVKKGLEPADEELFYTKWGEKNNGVTRNRFKEVAGAAGKAGSTGSTGPASGGGKSKSLFG